MGPVVPKDAITGPQWQYCWPPSLRILNKGYGTNIDPKIMDGHAVEAAYHDLWKVEQSFRMAKLDLKARPIYHRTRESIEAHLTIVFAALAIARHL